MPIIHLLGSTRAEAEEVAARIGAVDLCDVGANYRNADETAREIWTGQTHHGLCLVERERNMRDDSDFLMTVWDVATGAPVELMFATTRGWSYPCMGSRADATPDIVAKYEAWKLERENEARERRARVEAVTPRKGRTVRVIAGRKVPKGTEAVVFWERIERVGFFSVEGQYWTPTGRIGLEVPGMGRVFVDAGHVEVVAEVSR